MKQVKRLAIAFVSTTLFFVAFDLVGGLLCNKLYHDAKYSLFARQNYVLKESQDDIIILGSSRASHHYIPSIFQDTLGMPCFNAGSDGQCIYYHYGAISAVLERGKTPHLVVYEVMDLDAEVSHRATFTIDAALDRFSPHYGEFTSLDSLFILRGALEKYKLCSQLYRYNSQLVQLLNCRFNATHEDKGYERVDGWLKIDEKPEKMCSDGEIDKRKVEYFRKLINKMKAHDVTLILVQSPMFSIGSSRGIDTLKKIAEQENVQFIDMKNDPELMQNKYFRDGMHLNHVGAQLFSAKLASTIKQIME